MYSTPPVNTTWALKKGFFDYLWRRGDYYQKLASEYRANDITPHWHWSNSMAKLSTGEAKPLFEVFLYKKQTIECPARNSSEIDELLTL